MRMPKSIWRNSTIVEDIINTEPGDLLSVMGETVKGQSKNGVEKVVACC